MNGWEKWTTRGTTAHRVFLNWPLFHNNRKQSLLCIQPCIALATVLQVPCSRTEICNRFLSSSFDLVFTLVRIVQQGTLNWKCKHVVFVAIFVLSAVTCLKRHIDGLRVKHLHQGCNDLVGFLMTSILLIRTESIQTAQTAVYCRKQCSK